MKLNKTNISQVDVYVDFTAFFPFEPTKVGSNTYFVHVWKKKKKIKIQLIFHGLKEKPVWDKILK